MITARTRPTNVPIARPTIASASVTYVSYRMPSAGAPTYVGGMNPALTSFHSVPTIADGAGSRYTGMLKSRTTPSHATIARMNAMTGGAAFAMKRCHHERLGFLREATGAVAATAVIDAPACAPTRATRAPAARSSS